MPGAIVKRSATNYAVKVYVGQGKSKWYSGFRTRREAQAFQVSMASNPLHAAGMGLYGSTRLRLGTYLTSDWLPERRPGSSEERSKSERSNGMMS